MSDGGHPTTIVFYAAVTVVIASLTVDALNGRLPPHMETLLVGALMTALAICLWLSFRNAARNARKIRAETRHGEGNA
jgi:hypothetical protein